MMRGPQWSEALREVAPLLSLGIQLALILVVGVGIGWWVDDRFSTSPWGILGGAVFGIGSGLYHFLRAALAIGEGKGTRRKDEP